MNPPKTNWYVLTGRPCSGISTTVEALGNRGLPVVGEAARALIDEHRAAGQTVEEVRRDDRAFQQAILERKIDVESELPRNRLRVFDRALPDSVAYHELAGLDPREVLKLCEPGLYRKIFFMEPVPWVRDYARTEDAPTLAWLGGRLRSVYLTLGYEVVSVPAGPLEDRVRLVRSHIDEKI